MERWHYSYAGLRVASELPIPEWAPFRQSMPFDDADVLIALEREPMRDVTKEPALVTACEYRFHVPEAGSYLVRQGREIVVAPASGADAREIRLFVLGSAWGALCYQRGILLLHCSIVRVGDYAVAFCGETGSGKSSAAAWLLARGHRLVGDDLCRFDVADGIARAYPSAARVKLWRDALVALGWNSHRLQRDHFRLDKFHADVGDCQVADSAPIPLRAVYLLEWGDARVARLTGLTALRRLVEAATYRGDLLDPMGRVAAHWQRCAELLSCVPVCEFSRPREWSAMGSAMDLLAAHEPGVFRMGQGARPDDDNAQGAHESHGRQDHARIEDDRGAMHRFAVQSA